MSADDFAPALDRSRTLRSQFALAVAEVIDNDPEEANGGSRGRLSVSNAFSQQLTEVAWSWTTTALAPDLERFAKHAKRKAIGPEDVVLAARKNEVTHSLIDGEAQRLKPPPAANKRQRADT